ncbi:MAG: hypothetical protein OIN86_06465 [Candidatus Methanoperedens sp.]|nr:hypothetical protein [Candidatus Methanoperedens sp.]CAG0955166.1 hypothetical protein METP1_00406 [Methanosarcinales archaeon]
MELIDEDELIFKLTKEWVQQESNDIIGRNLSDDELDTVKKCIEWGLLTDIDTVFKTAIFEATKDSQI